MTVLEVGILGDSVVAGAAGATIVSAIVLEEVVGGVCCWRGTELHGGGGAGMVETLSLSIPRSLRLTHGVVASPSQTKPT